MDDSSDPGSGVDFKSRNEDRISVSEVPMLTAADMVSLPKGQAFALLEGGHLWKIRMPLPDSRGDDAMPTAFTEIAEDMQRTYIMTIGIVPENPGGMPVWLEPRLACLTTMSWLMTARLSTMAEVSDSRRPISQPGTFSRILTGLAQCVKWLLVS